MADEVGSTSGTGFGLAKGDDFCGELDILNWLALTEDQDDHVPFHLLSRCTNQEPHQPIAFDREHSNNGGGIHGSSDGWSAVSGALSFTTTYGPDVEEQQLPLPGIAEIGNTQQQQHSQTLDNSGKHHLSCGTHSSSSSLDSDGYDTASSESVRDEMHQQSKMKIDYDISIRAPELGMEFSSEEDAYKFYKDYAKAIGFSVRKGKYQRSPNGTIRKRHFLCSCQGFRLNKHNSNAARYRRKETRTGCKAMVQITNENETWKISLFVLEHNHNLGGSTQKYKGSCTQTSQTPEDHMTKHTKAGMQQKAGDAVGAKFCNVDRTSYLGYQNQCSLNPEDVQALINYLKQLQLEDQSFFYTLQVDAKNSLTNFFWRDGRSKMDYQYFGDVLVLDTTFQVGIGLQRMSCAPFLGLNHHRQYVLFGCALLLDESKDSFMWLFGTFMEAMGGRQPKTILTNDCQAMADAIKEILPDTRHHLGMWYIQQTAAEHLFDLYQQSGFKNYFNRCIFGCQSEEEFDLLWDSLVEQHNQHENECLNTLHALRKKWSPVFTKSAFSAGLQSTDDCKAIITVFQNLTRQNMTLLQIAQRYQKVAKEQRKIELDEDFSCSETSPLMILKGSTLEKQAADVYTCTMFKLFQEELRGCLSVAIEDTGNNGTVATFKLKEQGQKDNIVNFCDSLNQISCSCKKYESVGILCVHILKVLNAKNVFQLPSQYILKRWTKSAKHEQLLNNHIGAADMSQKSLKVRKLKQKALNVITKSAAVEESYKIVEDCLAMALGKVENVLKTKRTHHQDKGKDVEILYTGNEGVETHTVLSAPPFQKEATEHRMRSKSKRKHEDDESDISCRSMDDGVLHRQPPKKAIKGAENEGARAISSHSYFAGECSQQPASISPRPPLPSQPTVHHFRGFSKPMGNFQERKKQAPDAPVSRREMETMEMMIMATMKEMQEGILKAINENMKSLP